MQTIIVAERDVLKASRFNIYTKIELEDVHGAWRQINPMPGGQDYFIGARWSDVLDQPMMSGTLTLSRQVQLLSIAPTIQGSDANHGFAGEAYDPFIRGGQKVRITTACTAAGVAPIAGDWHEVFLGKIDDPEWGEKANYITLAIADQGSWLMAQEIREQKDYSTDAGVPVETVMQEILDDNVNPRLGPVALYVPVSPGWNIRAFTQQQQPVLEALRTLAQQIGWDVRYRYDAAGVFRLTLFQPDRAKTVADTQFADTEYFQIPSVSENTQDIRNWIVVRFIDATTGEASFAEYKNADSIAKYGELYMEVGEDSTSNIDSITEAQAMADAIGSDLSEPFISQTMRTSYFWPAQLGDLYEFLPNFVHYDVSQKLAVVSIEHVLTREERSSTIAVRGKPAGAYADWIALKKKGAGLGGTDAIAAMDFLNFREKGRDLTGITYICDGYASIVDQINVYELTVPNPVSSDPFETIRTAVIPASYDTGTVEWKFLYPPHGNTKYVQIEVRDSELNPGGLRRLLIQAQSTIPWFADFKQTPSVSGLSAAVRISINDSLLKGGTLKAWTNRAGTGDADPTGAPDGTLAIVATPYTATTADSFALTGGGVDTLLSAIPIDNGKGKSIFFEFINSDGLSTGILRYTLLSNGSVIGPDGELLSGSIKTALQFVSSVQPVQVFATTLPDPAADGTFAFLISTGKLYRRSGGVWTSAVPAVDLTGQVVSSQIADAAISTAKFAAGIRPVRIVSALPGAGDVQGDTVFLTTDNKLYRWTGAAWTSAVPTVDLSGTIATAQIALNAITSALIAASAVTSTQIATDAVTTPKILAGSITAVKIAAATITSNEIAAGTITASNILAATITGTQIAAGTITASNIAADTITAGQIAASAVSTSELAANAVTAAKIAVGTITSNEIAANTIVAGNIAAATITGTQIAAATISATNIVASTITSGLIAAGAITTTALAAGAVTATKISVSTLASVSTDAGILVAGKLTSVNGQSYLDLNATGANAFLRHADSGGTETLRLNANGTATFSGTIASSSFTTGAASFSGIATFVGEVRITSTGGAGGLFFYDAAVVSASIKWFAGGGGALAISAPSAGNEVLVSSPSFVVQTDQINNHIGLIIDDAIGNNDTALNIRLKRGAGAASFDRVTVGATDSGGVGFRALVITN